MKQNYRQKSKLQIFILAANTLILGFLVLSQFSVFKADENSPAVNLKPSKNSTGLAVIPANIKLNDRTLSSSAYEGSREVVLSGVTKPSSTVIITIYSNEYKYFTKADHSGSWRKAIDLNKVEPGKHIVTVKYINGTEFSPEANIISFRKDSIFRNLTIPIIIILIGFQVINIRILFRPSPQAELGSRPLI